MPSFTVRMVLHNANSDDYSKLEAAMEIAGFVDYIKGSSGKTYRLPDAEYIGDAANVDAALELAKSAAGSVGRKFAVFTTESRYRKWVGLEEIS